MKCELNAKNAVTNSKWALGPNCLLIMERTRAIRVTLVVFFLKKRVKHSNEHVLTAQ